MSCSAVATFRLLDGYVGWDPALDPGPYIVGLGDPTGIRLGPLDPEAVDPSEVDRLLGSPRLARGCTPCTWYLVVPGGKVVWRDPCGEPDGRGCLPFVVHRRLSAWVADPVAIAVSRMGIAIADRSTDTVVWFSSRRDRTPAVIDVAQPRVLAFTAHGALLVATGGRSIRRFDPVGAELRALPRPPAEVLRMRVADGGTLWIAVDAGAGRYSLWSLERDATSYVVRTLAELRAAFDDQGVVAVGLRGFCLSEPVPERPDRKCCYDWGGRPASPSTVEPGPARHLHEHGVLTTVALDSEIPRCRWHRVRVDADIPLGTSVRVEVASSDDGAAPHADDWNGIASDRASPTDFLIDQPPGRYLFVRIVLRGDGSTTPIVRRVRLDMPRVTSAELLPDVYRAEPVADDFIERFLGLFDASIAELDVGIERFTALFDVRDVPAELLGWLGSFIGVAFEPSWAPERRRALLATASALFRKRGTVAGLREVIEVVTGRTPAIREPARSNPYGALTRTVRLGETRLFGRLRARFHLDASQLGSAPLVTAGNPDADPLTEGAFRLEISLPGPRDSLFERRLRRLIEQHKPAHTVATLRVGGEGFVLGPRSALGIDTQIGALPAPVLGREGNVRLRRSTVLWRRRAN